MMTDLVAEAHFDPGPMEAWLFSLRQRPAGPWKGGAVICPAARYASIAWRGIERLDRRFARPEHWRAIEQEIALGLSPAPLPTTSAIAQLLKLEWPPLEVTYVRRDPVRAKTPLDVVTQLDRQLLAAVATVP